MVVLAVDAMGGDIGPSVTLPACIRFLNQHADARVRVVGLESALAGFSHPRAECVIVSQVITMDDALEVALRKKKDSSMRRALMEVEAEHAQAAISAGNTGALMALARYVFKTLEGIERPAIATQLPNMKGRATTVLDLGANVDCKAEHLLQFGVMGSVLLSALTGDDRPQVGLLNVGQEAIKGSEVIRQAGELLRRAHERDVLCFAGNVEGNDIFKGTVDIVVCDGFVGNVALKASEGVASMVRQFMREEFLRTPLTRLSAWTASPVLHRLTKRLDPRQYNGAALLGLRGLVFKSHGSADSFAFEQALNRAYEAVRHQVLDRVQKRIAKVAPLISDSLVA